MTEGFGEAAERLRRATGHVPRCGSGVIWDDAGLIVTNAHVPRMADRSMRLRWRAPAPRFGFSAHRGWCSACRDRG